MRTRAAVHPPAPAQYEGAWHDVKASARLALFSLLLTLLLCPGAQAERRPGVPAPSSIAPAAVPQASPSPSDAAEEAPNLTQMLHLTADQITKMRDLNERVRQNLVDERRRFRESVLGVLTDTQRTRLRQLLVDHMNDDRPDVDLQKELGLTQNQLDALRRLQTAEQLRLDAMWTEYIGQIKALLTPTQAAALEDYLHQQATAP